MNDPQPEGHMASYIGRRKFLATLGGVAAAWPLAARAQQSERMRRIGVLGLDEDDPAAKLRVSSFTQALAELGWTDGRTVRIDFRWAGIDINRIRALGQELVGAQPDIILASALPAVAAVPAGARAIP